MESMDFLDSDSSGIRMTTSMEDDLSSSYDVSSSYAASYLESFLPAYQMVNQSAITGVADRYRAIKFAADASLALTASGASWSDALKKMLVEVSEENVSGDRSANEDEFSRRTSEAKDLSSSSAASISSREHSPELDSNDLCEPSGSHETVSDWGRKPGGVRSPDQLRKGLAGRRKSVVQRFAGREARRNRIRNQRLSRDATRLAILRTLSVKCKSKQRRYLKRASLKPRRAIVRKVKSLAKSWRCSSRFSAKPVVECPEQPEQRFENGLVALQRLVPGGSNMLDAAVLLDEAADFVMFLKLQVQALQSVANAVGIDACAIES